MLRLLIYYACYKAKQAFLSFLPAFKPFTLVFPLFIGVFADFAAFSPFHAFLQHLPLFIGVFANQTSLLSPSASFISFCLITRVLIWLSRSSVRFYLVFTNLPVFTAFQHVFLCLSVFPRFSLLYPLIFEFFFSIAHIKVFMRTCIFTGFHSLFLGFCHISGSSARFPLFFGCFSDFCGVFYDFLPLCSFQAKNRLFSAFIGFLRLFARFCLFCSFFLTIGLLTPF